MSRDEKKRQLVRLYSGDVQAADAMLSSGEKTLEALRDELDAVRRAAGVKQALPDSTASPRTASTNAEVERLRLAVENAAAVLRALVPLEDPDDAAGDDAAHSPTRVRARSEQLRECGAGTPLRPALCRTPRSAGRPKRKVSFGSQPEEEPARARLSFGSDEDEMCDKEVVLSSPPLRRKQRDSLGLYRDKPTGTETSELEDSEELKLDAGKSSGPRSAFKMHAALLIGGAGCGLLLAATSHQLGAGSSTPTPSSPTLFGDPSCWVNGWRPDYCCLGAGGNPSCWDKTHTYERCCIPKSEL